MGTRQSLQQVVLEKLDSHTHKKNSKVLLKEIKDTNKWKDILCSWIFSTTQSNIQIQCSPHQIPTFSAEIEKSIIKFVWSLKGPRIAKTILKKKKKKKADFKTYYTKLQ